MRSLITFVRTLHREVKFFSWFDYLQAALVLVFSIALIRDTYYVGNDFQVFHKSVQYFFNGISIYDLSHAREMVFKYPPWWFPLIIPFGLIPYKLAALVWGVVQVVSLFVVGRELYRRGAHPWVLRITFTVFWGLWAVHALDGQVMLPLLAFGMFFLSRAEKSPLITAVITFLFSAKIFSILAVAPLWKSILKPHTLSLLVVFLVIGVAISFSRAPESKMTEFFHSWKNAASSGSALMDGGKTRGRENQGLPVLVLRAFNIPIEDAQTELAVAFFVTLAISVFGLFLTRGLGLFESFIIWLPLAVITHPLSWFHSFTWVFPIAVMTLSSAMVSKNRVRLAIAALGVLLVCVVTEKTLGDFGKSLELLSVKSLGALVLIFTYRRILYMRR